MACRRVTVAERIMYLHDSEKFFDLEFILHCGGQTEKIKAHKAIFASCSDVFEAMLYGPMAMGDIIEINDVELEIFKAVKKFFYTDVIVFHSVIHALQVFKIADMYNLVQLSTLAEKYLFANLSTATVLRVLEFSRGFQKLEMQEQCLDIIRRETLAVLNSDDFLSCDLNFVDLIVSKEELNVKEIELFSSVEKWAENNMISEDSPPENEKQLMNEVINKIRFLSMTVEEFASGPIKSSLLTKEDRLHLISNIAVPGSLPLPDRFSKEKSPRNADFFTARENGYVTTIKWDKRGISQLLFGVKYFTPQFKINGFPFTLFLKPFIGRYKYLGVYLRCNQDNVKCKLDFTERYLRQGRKPLTYRNSRKFNETDREVRINYWHWSSLVNDSCRKGDDCLFIEWDFTFYHL